MVAWTEKDVERLKKYYQEEKTSEEIAKLLNRTVKAIRNKAYVLEITRDTRYTEYQKQYVIDNYKSYNAKEVAKHIGIDPANVCRLAKQLGIKRTHKKKEFTKGEKDENGLWHVKGFVRKTKEETFAKKSEITKEWHKNNEHPRGMLGKTHSDKVKKDMSIRFSNYFKTVTQDQLDTRRLRMIHTKIKNDSLSHKNLGTNCYSRTKGGKREDLNNVFFRSSWEANIARYFNDIGVEWKFEPKTFYFDPIRRGCVSYTPDFYLPKEDKWVEVKGWMDDKSKTRLKRFEKYHPEESKKLWLIDAKAYREIEKKYKHIDNWE